MQQRVFLLKDWHFLLCNSKCNYSRTPSHNFYCYSAGCAQTNPVKHEQVFYSDSCTFSETQWMFCSKSGLNSPSVSRRQSITFLKDLGYCTLCQHYVWAVSSQTKPVKHFFFIRVDQNSCCLLVIWTLWFIKFKGLNNTGSLLRRRFKIGAKLTVPFSATPTNSRVPRPEHLVGQEARFLNCEASWLTGR